MPAGAPSKYTPKLAEQICALIASGKSLRTICKSKDMPSTVTVFKWLNKYPEFVSQYTRAREEQADAIFDEMLDIADESVNDFMVNKDGSTSVNQEAIQRSRLRIDARKWVLGKMKPKKYGEKVEVDMTADLTHHYEITTKGDIDPDDIGYTES